MREILNKSARNSLGRVEPVKSEEDVDCMDIVVITLQPDGPSKCQLAPVIGQTVDISDEDPEKGCVHVSDIPRDIERPPPAISPLT